MILESQVPIEYWGWVVRIAVDLHRRTLNESLRREQHQYITPYDMLYCYGKLMPRHITDKAPISYAAPLHHLRRFRRWKGTLRPSGLFGRLETGGACGRQMLSFLLLGSCSFLSVHPLPSAPFPKSTPSYPPLPDTSSSFLPLPRVPQAGSRRLAQTLPRERGAATTPMTALGPGGCHPKGRPGLSRAPACTPQSPKSHWEVWAGEA